LGFGIRKMFILRYVNLINSFILNPNASWDRISNFLKLRIFIEIYKVQFKTMLEIKKWKLWLVNHFCEAHIFLYRNKKTGVSLRSNDARDNKYTLSIKYCLKQSELTYWDKSIARFSFHVSGILFNTELPHLILTKA